MNKKTIWTKDMEKILSGLKETNGYKQIVLKRYLRKVIWSVSKFRASKRHGKILKL